MAISNLTNLTDYTQLSGSDTVPFSSVFAGDDARASWTVIAQFLSTIITNPSALTTQYATPIATGFSVAITASSTWLILTPLAGYAAGTLVLPASPVHCSEFLVNTTQAVTTLTVSGNGKTVVGAPTTLAANAFFRLRYNSLNSTWFRVG
jgi:hypothetical protein